jgi:predicted O-methyltransferase YrrM
MLAKYMEPRLSVELGVCGGGASLHLALGWPAGKVIGIDIGLDYPGQIAYVAETCPNFTFWRQDSVQAARRHIEEGPVDILFVDTIHTHKRTLEEVDAWQSHMAAGAVVCLDDLHRPGMQEAWDAIPGEKIRLDHLHLGGNPEDGGFGVVLL